MSESRTESSVSLTPAWSDLFWFLPYLAALLFRREIVPPGLNNDAAEEALRGLALVEGRHFEVMSFAVGNSAETLYLYIVGVTAKLLGPTMLAVQLPSWTAAIITIWFFSRAVRPLDASIPRSAAPLLAVSSIWLFHYARTGLRAITAPLFLLLFWLTLDRAEQHKTRREIALACGAVLGLSLYAYTSCRVLPVIFVVYAVIRLSGASADRKSMLRRYAWIALGALLTSLPNLWFFFRFPSAFLSRGSYVLPAEPRDAIVNIALTFLLPTGFYPSNPSATFDGVSSGLAAANIYPIHPIVAAAFLLGLVKLWSIRRERAGLFLLVAWPVATLAPGVAGPSLTRMLILLPVYLAVAGLGVAEAARRFPAARLVCAALLVAAAVTHAYAYFTRVPASPDSAYYFSPDATAMANRADILAAQGQRVLCVVFKDASVIRYLTHRHAATVHVNEFFFRPPVIAEIPLMEFRPTVLLIDRYPTLETVTRAFPDAWRQPASVAEPFDEIRIQHR